MADNTRINTGQGGDLVATDDVGGVKFQRIKLTFGTDGVAQDVSCSNQLPIKSVSLIDTGNSSTATLGGGATFTGTFRDISDYASTVVTIFADQASATDGVIFEWSTDGTNVDVSTTAELSASAGRAYNLSPRAQFFRVRYTNGGTPQTAFRLETIHYPTDTGFIARPLDKTIDDTFFAQLMRSVLAAKRNDGTYGNIRSTNGNNIKVSVSEFEDREETDDGSIATGSLCQRNTPLNYIFDGSAWVRQRGHATDGARTDHRRGLTLAFASIDVASSGDNTIVGADATRKIKVLSYVIVADAAVTARWKSGAGTNLSGAMSLAANGGVSAPPVAPAAGHWLETAANEALVLNLGSATGVRGHLSYVLEA